MTPSPTTQQQAPGEDLTDQFLAYIARGATLGNLIGFQERDYETAYAIGHKLYMRHRFDDAVKIFGFLAMHNHLERRFVMAFASALQMAKDHASAIRIYTLAAIMDPDNPWPCFHTCECLIALGMKAEALEGLAIVVQQCEDRLPDLRARALAVLDLLSNNAAVAAEENQ